MATLIVSQRRTKIRLQVIRDGKHYFSNLWINGTEDSSGVSITSQEAAAYYDCYRKYIVIGNRNVCHEPDEPGKPGKQFSWTAEWVTGEDNGSK